MEDIRRLRLSFYGFYSRLLYPFYRRLTVDSLDLIISNPDIMHPLCSAENLLFGDLRGKTVLDIGTGCGIIALVAKKLGAKYVLGVDIDEAAISNAETNLKNNFPDSRGIEFRCSDLYQSVTNKFDIIVSNPPYFKDLPTRPSDYKFCGGDMLDRILKEGKHYLKPSGEIRVLHPASSTSYMMALAEKFEYSLDLVDLVPKKDNWWLRLLLGRTVRPSLTIYTFKIC